MFLIPSPIEKIETSWSKEKQVDLFVKREDLIHPLISGNKFRKLKYNLAEARNQGKNKILSFGGAYSNHIHALAAACHFYGFQSIGIIRGEENSISNPTLTDAKNRGMELHFVDRVAYREKASESFIQSLKEKFGDFYLVPEGGTNPLAIQGTSEILQEIDFEFDYVCAPVGSGGTIAGLINSCPKASKVLGFSALKGDFINDEVKKLLGKEYNNWEINTEFHFGGYAKTKPELLEFINGFKQETYIELEPIYSGKMFFGLRSLILRDFFKPKTKIVAIHTGGLQGLRGFQKV